MANNDKTYLGDSVYFEFDGYNVELYTNNGRGPENSIILEPETLVALLKKVTSNEFLSKLMPKEK